MAISKVVLITGCSTGIGRATAERLASKGMTVYATARNADTLTDLKALGCRTMALDVTDDDSMVAAVDAIEREHGAVGALVNNAGFGLEGPFEEAPMDDVRRQFETNVMGVVRLTQLVMPKMRAQRWGRIVNVGSMGGRLTFPGGAFYHATKHAMEGMTDVLRYEAKGFGIGVSLIQPGLIATQFGASSIREIPDVGDGPYGSYKKALFDRVYGAYHGKQSRLAAKPDAVAKAIQRAITSSRPRTRYRVTAGARILLVTHALVPDRVWDAMMTTQFPRPR